MKAYIAGQARWRLPREEGLPPGGAKVLLLTRGGVCIVGVWAEGCVAWAPLPEMSGAVRFELLEWATGNGRN